MTPGRRAAILARMDVTVRRAEPGDCEGLWRVFVFRLELTVFTDNERAIALYRKFGFEAEGTHRAYALRDGRYADVLAMARLRPKSP